MTELTGRILVVEDDNNVRRTWCRVLSRAGYRVSGVGTVDEARREIDQHGFDVVLLDFRLQTEQGTELLPDLLKLCPPPSIAMISGFLDANLAVDLCEKDVTLIPKPIGSSALVRVTSSLIEKKKSKSGRAGFCHRHSFSPRELQQIRAAANGMSNKQIGDLIDCQPATVATYWQRIFKKTGCHARNEVLALLIRCPLRAHACAQFLETSWNDENPS